MHLPASVTEIGEGAFQSCYNIKHITMLGYLASIEEDTFKRCDGLQAIIAPHIPLGRLGKYQTQAVMGYLTQPERYEDPKILKEYHTSCVKQAPSIRRQLIREDQAQALAVLGSLGVITAANFEQDYFRPAQEAQATACVAFLLDWKQKHIPTEMGWQNFEL